MKSFMCAAGLVASLGVAAANDEWRYRSADVDVLEVREQGQLARTDSGFLQGVRDRMLRRDTDGQLMSDVRVDPVWQDNPGFSAERGPLLPLDDGGWLTVPTPFSSPSDCGIQRFNAQGQRVWTSGLQAGSGACDSIEMFEDARGGWLLSSPSALDRDQRLLRLREDGQHVPLDLSAAGLASIDVLRQHADGSFDLALHDAQGLQLARLVEGRVSDVARAAVFSTLHSRRTVSALGELWITARGVDGDAGDSLMVFDAEGQRLLRSGLGLPANVQVQALAMVTDDAVAILTRDLDATVWELRFVDRQGTELARLRPSGTPTGFAPAPALRPFAAPGVVALMDGRLVRETGYDVQGSQVPTPIELGGRGESPAWPAVQVERSQLRQLAAWDAFGGELDMVVGDSAARLRSLDSEGRELPDWVSSTGPWPRAYPIDVVGNDTRICVGPLSFSRFVTQVTAQAACIDRHSRQTLHVVDNSLEGVASPNALRPLSMLALAPDQRLLSLTYAGHDESPTLMLLSTAADGSSGTLDPLARLAGPLPMHANRNWRASLNGNGDVVLAQPHPSGGVFLLMARSGGIPVQARLATDVEAQVQAVLDRGTRGVALAVGIVEGAMQRDELWLVDAEGRLNRRVELGNGSRARAQVLLREIDGELVLAHAVRPTAASALPRARQVIGRLTDEGSWRWRRGDARVGGDALVDLQLAGARALVLSERAGQPRLEQVDLAGGQSLDVRSLRCPGSLSCRPLGLVVDAHNHARLIAEVDDIDLGPQVELQKFALAEPGRAGVPHLAGLWFAPESSGQGLVLGVMPGSNALLGGWFSYAEGGVNRSADQRWYALEARYAPGSTSMTIQARRAAGAAFNVDGAAAVQDIGSGELYLRGCGEAVFRYRFDAGEESGLAGEIPMLRLGPGGADCAAPAAALADGGGFSQRQSGAWYDPAQGGQGLVMEVLPPQPGAGGLFSAGWFTFDPQGAADDPHAQHWFLVQVDIPSTASGGAVEVPIYNAIGGRLDAGRTRNVIEVGLAKVQMLGCERAQVDYAFGDDAGAYAGRSGRLDLHRLGGCEGL